MATRRRMLRFVVILCVLGVVLALLPACGGSEPPSDQVIKAAARAFAKALKAAGEDAEVILERAREEAKKWGPKAQLFIEIVIDELQGN